MRRDYVRSRILYPGLVLLALLLFLVPEAQVESLRAQALSALSPVLRLFGSAGRNPQPQPALIAVSAAPSDATQAKPAPPPEDHSAAIDLLNAECIRLRDRIAQLQNTLPAPSPFNQPHKDGRNAALSLPPGLGADVIARKVLWQEPILGLNRGAADGVTLHAGVLHRGAVVGRIISVGPHASCMALLTHRGMSVAARLAESRVEGVLQGGALPPVPVQEVKGEETERLCRMSVVGREVNAKTGEVVVTSGLDGAFPPGLWLGVVAGLKKKGDVQWEIAVRPACNENAVECVHILKVALPEVPWPAMPKK